MTYRSTRYLKQLGPKGLGSFRRIPRALLILEREYHSSPHALLSAPSRRMWSRVKEDCKNCIIEIHEVGFFKSSLLVIWMTAAPKTEDNPHVS